MLTYAEKLNATKASYPFAAWRDYWQKEPDSVAGCNAVERLMDELLANLIELGEAAPAAEKIAFFQQAIEGSNAHDGVIETTEREELCELTNVITEAAGLNPDDYGGGEGLASEWRDW